MIVPMKKISLIISGDKKEQTLKTLRKLGLMHIEISEGTDTDTYELRSKISLLEAAIFTVGEKVGKDTVQKEMSLSEAYETAQRSIFLNDEIKRLKEEYAVNENELARIEDWGEFDPKQFDYLREKGIVAYPCRMSFSEYKRLGEGVQTVVVNRDKSTVRFLEIQKPLDQDDESKETLKSFRVVMPKAPTSEIRKKSASLMEKIEESERELASYASYSSAMKKAIASYKKEIQFISYVNGMENENLSSKENGKFSVAYFQGYTEAEKLDVIVKAAKENSWGIIAEDPTPDDNAPTKLKNNKLVSLIYPITDFLGTVPGYFEYDISGWFLGFLLVFFGIIFGDGGYGLLVTAVAAIPIIKALKDKKKIQPAFLLIGLFGLSTILWGILTCTWFGIPAELLPKWLQSISVPVISNVYADKIWYPFWTNGKAGLTTSQNVQIFCFLLALVQLCSAHFICAVRNRKSLKILGDIGAAMELFGIFYIVLSLVVNSAVFSFGLIISGIPIGTVAIGMIGIGFVMNFVFSNYEGSIGKSITASLKNIVSVLLGVVNVFSDIVSYIRLWAVGLAGAAISATVNELVGPFLGNFMFMIFAIIILVFGHGLNMILNVLSVVVHGLRLNTLEFSSHLDMSWSGHKYEPFKE